MAKYILSKSYSRVRLKVEKRERDRTVERDYNCENRSSRKLNWGGMGHKTEVFSQM
jgi:hypothetical protein